MCPGIATAVAQLFFIPHRRFLAIARHLRLATVATYVTKDRFAVKVNPCLKARVDGRSQSIPRNPFSPLDFGSENHYDKVVLADRQGHLLL